MYRKANITDMEKILNIETVNIDEKELKKYFSFLDKYIYVCEEDSNIIAAAFYGADDVEDDSFDSELYSIHTTKGKGDDGFIISELIYGVKKDLYDMGYRKMIVWCDENNDNEKSIYKNSGGKECMKREKNNNIQVAYGYTLYEYEE